MEEAAIGRKSVYITNTVKHFKWVPAGKRRLHKKPNAREIAACRPWLDAVDPRILVALGATAAQALMGREFRVTQELGKLIPLSEGRHFLATVHPSSILRAPPGRREIEREHFVEDLRVVAHWLSSQERSRRVG